MGLFDELYTPEYKPTGKEIAVFTTNKGTIRVQLAGKDAPIHVGNFVELAKKGFYDGRMRMARWPWRVPLIPTQQVRSSISAWARSISWIQTTPFSAKRLKDSTRSPHCAKATLSKASLSRTQPNNAFRLRALW